MLETTICKDNIDHIERFNKKLKKDIDHKVKNKSVLTLYHEGYLYDNCDNNTGSHTKNMDKHKIDKIVKTIKKKSLKPQNMIQNIYLEKIEDYLDIIANQEKRQVMPCQALRDSFSIDSDGTILPCLMWDENLGNIKEYDYDIMKAWKCKNFRHTRKLIKESKCPVCWTPCEAYQTIISDMLRKIGL